VPGDDLSIVEFPLEETTSADKAEVIWMLFKIYLKSGPYRDSRWRRMLNAFNELDPPRRDIWRLIRRFIAKEIACYGGGKFYIDRVGKW
jgi:hypothetical protein